MSRTNKDAMAIFISEFREMEPDSKTMDTIEELIDDEDSFAILMSCVSYIIARSPNFEYRMNDSVNKFKKVIADICKDEVESIN